MYYTTRAIPPQRGGWATVQMSPQPELMGAHELRAFKKEFNRNSQFKKICKAILRMLTPNYVPNFLSSMPKQMVLCIEVDNGFIKNCCYIFKILCYRSGIKSVHIGNQFEISVNIRMISTVYVS